MPLVEEPPHHPSHSADVDHASQLITPTLPTNDADRLAFRPENSRRFAIIGYFADIRTNENHPDPSFFRKEQRLQAVVLVGGEGTRLRPLTLETPKPMVPIMNVPFLERTLQRLKEAGIDDVILPAGYLPAAISRISATAAGSV